ncbi:restriction endonuclease [Streptomyces sp. NPDC046727]|uniref:restriction endonuclease n=1 Tax=Streptomyces sp. NPDC046727 TaxID=3155373 RepID=UPI00340C40D4
MARKKSLTAQLVQAYRDAQKAKEAEAKRQQQLRKRAVRAAEQERKRQERDRARQEREQAQEWARTQKAAERERLAQARAVEQVERDLAKREAARARQTEAKKKAAQRQAAGQERLAKQQAAQEMRTQAERRTAEVQQRVGELNSVLSVPYAPSPARREQVETALAQGDPEALTSAVEAALADAAYLEGLRDEWRCAFVPETRELLLEVDLPGQSVIPTAAAYRYKASTPPAVTVQPRKEAEIKQMYRLLVARLSLRAINEVLTLTPAALVDVVAFNGHVNAKNRATGKAIRPCLVSVRASRETVRDLVLDEPELDPVACLRHLNAVVSQHPYDLEPVRPVVTFDLTKYKWGPDIDVVAGLDHRPDLMELDPIEFEHLVRRLFEAIGLKAWVTQASRDDGIDAVATNEDPIVGGLCIIQAKRTRNAVPADTVRALAGVMHDKAAAKGIIVTTAWFGKASKDFAYRTGRMELIDGRGLKALLLEHLGIDALISLPKTPPGWGSVISADR